MLISGGFYDSLIIFYYLTKKILYNRSHRILTVRANFNQSIGGMI